MTNFANSKIYKLRSDNLPDTCYIGSTTLTLEIRLSLHVYQAKRKKKQASRQIIDAGAYHIELLEEYPCTSSAELRQREQYYMGMHTCCNKQRAFRTEEEKIEQQRFINAKSNARSSAIQVQCFCGGRYSKHNKAQHYKTNKHQVAVEIISMI